MSRRRTERQNPTLRNFDPSRNSLERDRPECATEWRRRSIIVVWILRGSFCVRYRIPFVSDTGFLLRLILDFFYVRYWVPSASDTGFLLCPIPSSSCIRYWVLSVYDTGSLLYPILSSFCIRYWVPSVSYTGFLLCPILGFFCVLYWVPSVSDIVLIRSWLVQVRRKL